MATSRVLAADSVITRRRTSRATRKTIAFYAFIGPWLLGLVVLGVIPLLLGFITSLTNYDGLNLPFVRFVGFANYIEAVTDEDTSFSFIRSMFWAFLNVPIWLATSFIMALILNQAVAGRDFFRTLYYLPSVVPAVAAARIWVVFLNKNNGLINGVLSLFRPGTAINYLYDHALLSLTAISVWSGLGSGMVIFLAGLQGIPEELEEAALIDGANKLLVFRHITIPLMTPVIFFQLVLALINSLQAFAVPMLVYGDGKMATMPPRAVFLYVVHTYRNIFVYQRYSYGMALLWMLFLVILALTLLVFRSAQYWVHYESDVEGAES